MSDGSKRKREFEVAEEEEDEEEEIIVLLTFPDFDETEFLQNVSSFNFDKVTDFPPQCTIDNYEFHGKRLLNPGSQLIVESSTGTPDQVDIVCMTSTKLEFQLKSFPSGHSNSSDAIS